MLKARDHGTLRATPAVSRRRTLIGPRPALAGGPAVPSASKTCASLKDAISQFSPSAGPTASMAPLHYQKDIIAGFAKKACHPAEGIRIVMCDAAVTSRRHPVEHSSA